MWAFSASSHLQAAAPRPPSAALVAFAVVPGHPGPTPVSSSVPSGVTDGGTHAAHPARDRGCCQGNGRSSECQGVSPAWPGHGRSDHPLPEGIWAGPGF